MRQRSLIFRTWGGRRHGAGRKPNGARAGVPHLPRPALAARFPVLVTWRMDGAWNLRSRRCLRVLQRAMYAAGRREHFRLVHFAIMGNHVHLLVEASDRAALASGMKGLGVSIARRLNRLMGRRGAVIKDRYHARILHSLAQVRNARRYLLDNARRHYGHTAEDELVSQRPFASPRTWLMRQVC
jgi:putative transposase